MNWTTSIRLSGTRNLTVIWFAREFDMPIPKALNVLREELFIQDAKITFNGKKIKAPKFVIRYFNLVNSVLPKSAFAFPSTSGHLYRYGKFIVQLKNIFETAGIGDKYTTDPKNLSQKDYLRILDLDFKYSRLEYQIILVAMFLLFHGYRPSEVAHLLASDIDFESEEVAVRKPKNRKNRSLPIPKFMVKPLRRYISHLGMHDHMFVSPLSGKPWGRQDITRAISYWCKTHGVNRHVTSRIVRTCVANEIYEILPLEETAEYMGQSAEVAKNNYVYLSSLKRRRAVEKIYRASRYYRGKQ